ncbi:hypothetical protein WJT86_11720 [Microvirga sp. W0021]|uniref:ATP-grasp domain-containing protein n=1 Tax=Hohaiivirga grylli TaxID=3133970 RepID=A0ABV0BL48_9HYPH
MSRLHVIHENPAWIGAFTDAFDARHVPWTEWLIDHGKVDYAAIPPEGVFYNRMSASSHTRDHRYAPELTLALLHWLERHGRRVINGTSALDLEISKARQYARLERAGIRVPRTIVVTGKEDVLNASKTFFDAGQPVILKPNRGGKGLGVQLFNTYAGLSSYLNGPTYEQPVDGIQLLQEYIKAPEPYITRAEFVGGRFLYAVRVDTSEGFELCPAEACEIGDAFCPTTATPRPKFEIIDDIDANLKESYERFLSENGIEISGIEFIVGQDGKIRTYDVNTNTNYNPTAEAVAGRSATLAVADFLGGLVREYYPLAS